MKKKIKEFTLEELEELAKGKKIFGFRADRFIDKAPGLLIGKKYSSIQKGCSIEISILISPERDSYKKTIIDFFPEESGCAGEWFIPKIKWGVETLVKIGDPHKQKVTPLGIFNLKDKSYVLLKVSKEIHLLFEVSFGNKRGGRLYFIEQIKK